MRKIVVHMQTTLNNRIANHKGAFWEPFPWGDEEMAYITEAFRKADAWVMGRRTYEAIVPWWDIVADGKVPEDVPEVSSVMKEFADLLRGMTKVVFSKTLQGTQQRVVVRGNIAAELHALKHSAGRDIILSGGPGIIGPAASVPCLIDEYLLALHPAVISAGPQLFGELTSSLALRLVEAKVFGGGCVVLRYAGIGGHEF
jgi:dihydrofolate reductase